MFSQKKKKVEWYQNDIDFLPYDVIIQILYFLANRKDFRSFQNMCKLVHNIIVNDNYCHSLYQRLPAPEINFGSIFSKNFQQLNKMSLRHRDIPEVLAQ